MTPVTFTFTVTHPRRAAILTAVAFLLDKPGERGMALAGSEQAVRDLIQELNGFLCIPEADLFFTTASLEPEKWRPTIMALTMIIRRLEEQRILGNG